METRPTSPLRKPGSREGDGYEDLTAREERPKGSIAVDVWEAIRIHCRRDGEGRNTLRTLAELVPFRAGLDPERYERSSDFRRRPRHSTTWTASAGSSSTAMQSALPAIGGDSDVVCGHTLETRNRASHGS